MVGKGVNHSLPEWHLSQSKQEQRLQKWRAMLGRSSQALLHSLQALSCKCLQISGTRGATHVMLSQITKEATMAWRSAEEFCCIAPMLCNSAISLSITRC